MQTYYFPQWILFFFIYSFVGWIWECCYVSVKERRLVNRGFMHGPFLPLYGSGAVAVLVCTIAVRDDAVLVFCMGMAGATILEYITGAVMERLFRVKYWDYSRQKFNLKGYICLMASLCWGCFSVLLVKVIHPPVERAVLMIRDGAATAAACILSAGAMADFALSFREALDMKQLLAQLERSKTQIHRLQAKLKLTAAGAAEDFGFRARKTAERKLSGKADYLERIKSAKQLLGRQMEELSAKIESVMKGSVPQRSNGIPIENWRQELTEIRESILREFQKLKDRSDRRYLRIAGLLRRNPAAASEKFKEALEELKKIINGKQ